MKLFSTATAAALAMLAGLTAAQLPACPARTSLKTAKRPVMAGRITTIKLGVKNTGASAVEGMNVAINLPDDCCFVKGRVMPSLKKTDSITPRSPIVEGQNAYWLDFPLKAGKARSFSLKVRVSSLYTTATELPITASVYATNSTGLATCVTDAEAKMVSARGLCV